MLRNVYYALFDSHINYSFLNWSCASQAVLNPVYICQRKAIRIMSFKEQNSPCKELFKNLNILSLGQKKDLTYARFIWQCNNDLVPNCISDIFKTTRIPNTTKLRTRTIGYNFAPLFRTCVKERFISNSAYLIWRDIPIDIKSSKTLKSFSKAYIHFIT